MYLGRRRKDATRRKWQLYCGNRSWMILAKKKKLEACSSSRVEDEK